MVLAVAAVEVVVAVGIRLGFAVVVAVHPQVYRQ